MMRLNLHWNPIFSGITSSSVWRQPDHVRLAWIAILANKDFKTHHVRTNALILADQARISRENAEDALRVLCSPDPDSLDPEFEGRRLEKMPAGGYVVLNGARYSKLMSALKKKEYDLEYRKEERKKTEENVENGAIPDNRFMEFWRIYPKRVKKPNAMTAWKKIKPAEVDLILKDVCDRAVSKQWTDENGQYIPHPASYLNAREWEDDKIVAVADPGAAPPKSDWKAYEAWALKQVQR